MGDFMKPTQSAREYRQTDPFMNMKPQQQFTENLLKSQLGGSSLGRAGGVGMPANPFVTAGPQQQQALNALAGFQSQATPAFGTGLETLQKTAGGGYLDPMASAPFQRLSDARQNLAQMMFRDATGDINARAIAAGSPYSSSARIAQLGRRAGDISTQAAQDIAQAGWGQYGAERGMQEAAAARALGLAPGLAGQVFAGGEQLRGAEQQANTAQMQAAIQAQEANMRGRLAEMGLDQNKVNQLMEYLKLATGQALPSALGPSPWQMGLNTLNTFSSFMPGKPASPGVGAGAV
ncbi:MAG TPA: hypothetical protein VJ301_12040 [Propionibacteriaceae bacterium]|nr:hypothetical protein [Propionibacteriaceae bacterium]